MNTMAMDDLSSSSSSHNFSTNSFFTPLLISIMGIGATALAILFYHLLLVRYCMRRHATRMASLRTYTGDEIPAGVDEKTLQTLPIILYTKGDIDNNVTGDPCECAVCLGDVENGEMVRLLPNCKHFFHVRCIDEWFVEHTSCPVCRVPVVMVQVTTADDEIRGCPVCRSLADDRERVISVGSSPICQDQTLNNVDIGTENHNSNDNSNSNSNSNSTGFGSDPGIMLRHCNSLVLPGEKKGRFTGMELKRSLSMGQSNCVVIDMINIENVDKDCTYYSSLRDQSFRQLQRVSSKVKQSISRMCVGQELRSEILPY